MLIQEIFENYKKFFSKGRQTDRQKKEFDPKFLQDQELKKGFFSFFLQEFFEFFLKIFNFLTFFLITKKKLTENFQNIFLKQTFYQIFFLKTDFFKRFV